MSGQRYYPDQSTYSNEHGTPQNVSNLFDLKDSTGPIYSSSEVLWERRNSYPKNTSPQSRDRAGSRYECPPPPSYEESWNDRVISRSRASGYSPAWREVSNESYRENNHSPQKRSISELFDIPSLHGSVPKSSRWSEQNSRFENNLMNAPQSMYGNSSFQQSLNDSYKPEFYEDRFGDSHFSNEDQVNYSQFSNESEPFGKNVTPARPNFSSQGGFVHDSPRFRGQQQQLGNSQNNSTQRGRRRRFGRRNRTEKAFSNGDKNKQNLNQNQPAAELAKNDNEESNDDEVDHNEDNVSYTKNNVFYPDKLQLENYMYYPPSAEEMGKIFDGLVIYFFFKVKNVWEKNPFVIICESFRQSEIFTELDIEDGFQVGLPERKFCTIRYQGMMMARGVSNNKNIKEARVEAGVQLINKLAMTCYILKEKKEYFHAPTFKETYKAREIPGVFRYVSAEEVKDFDSAKKIIQNLLTEDSDLELIFELSLELRLRLKWWASQNGFAVRAPVKKDFIGICRKRSPQYWKNKMLANCQLENDKYILEHPKGIGNNLFENFDINEAVPSLKKVVPFSLPLLSEIYWPKGAGPKIVRALPPWEKRTRQNVHLIKMKQTIKEAIKKGEDLQSIKGFINLPKKQRKAFLRKEKAFKKYNIK